ncbi:sulfotransferase family protein [Roseiarcus sp.]|uniref:sulfotransferase family protein n=1 Tax=Roseiarcus sp. TaxID=1969460 RepID=UPI003F98FAE0
MRSPAVVVLGMHRSGTSSVAGALVRLGGCAPRHLLPASPDNAHGFWESTVVIALNEEVLAAGGSGWKDWRRFDISRVGSADLRAFRNRARSILLKEFGGAGIPVIKDPRMCRLMRFWQPVFEDVRWAPQVVLPIRSPLEVAWSLRRRDGLGVGAGCLLWLRHVFDAEADTRGMRRAVVDWSSFLDDWPTALGAVLDRLDVPFARCGDGTFSDIENFLSPDLRRFRASTAELHADPAVTALARDVYAAMLDLATDGDNAAILSRLDALSTRFEDAAAIFDSAMGGYERAAQALERANAVIAHYARGTPSKPDMWRLVASTLRRPPTAKQRELRTVGDSPFFDEAFYLSVNPDVRASRCDAALHFLVQGWREGRDPGPFFSTTGYLARNPDVAAAGVNPLVHYEAHGRKENRPAIG